MPRSTPDPAPRHRDDPPAKRTQWTPVLRTSVVVGVVVVIPHALIQLPFADRTRTLHTTTGLIFVVGVIDSLFLLAVHHGPQWGVLVIYISVTQAMMWHLSRSLSKL